MKKNVIPAITYIIFIHISSMSHTYTYYDNLVKNSLEFNMQTPLPTHSNQLAIIAKNDKKKQETITQQALNTKIVLHKNTHTLIRKFLTHKKKYGNEIEKGIYSDLKTETFINRLVTQRPLMFMTKDDSYLLRNGKTGAGGFENIGTDNESTPLILKDYLSYDEMQIAALLGIATPTFFINNGNRTNQGIPGDPGTYEPQGIYTGLVGARFEKQNLMEWQHMIVTPEQNIPENGYGENPTTNNAQAKLLTIWSEFYDEKFPTFQEVATDKTDQYTKLDDKTYLNNSLYKKRMRMVLEPFLLDANDQGKIANKQVYCHAVGLGLGVWQKTPIQAKLMLEVYANIIKDHDLSHISDINFSWFPSEFNICGGKENKEILKTTYNSIKIHFSKRNPADKLIGDDAEKLLVAQYAWDGNAYAGNEYWAGMLNASGDPAAACCSTIPELQNPLINSNILHNRIGVYPNINMNSRIRNNFNELS